SAVHSQGKETAHVLACLQESSSCASIVYYSIQLLRQYGVCPGRSILNSILVGSLRYSSNLTCGLLDYKFLWFGRKRAHTACQLLVLASLLISTAIFYSGYGAEYGGVVRVCVLIVCAMASQLCSRLGIVVAPHVFSWEEIWHYLPYTFMIVVTVMDVILFEVVLSETKNKPLEDHIAKRPKKSNAGVA
ncbi:hypothetical protein OSTOST_18747, partial [Ostertagia ostertagi]